MKKILITGANRGLGYALAEEALNRGHLVYAAVRSAETSPKLTALQTGCPERLVPVKVDVADEQSVKALADRLTELTTSLDVVINNAAVLLEREKTIETLDFEKLKESFEVNTFGPMRVIRHLLPLLLKGEAQSIINISSEAGSILNAFSTNYAYSMSKTALNMFTERLRYYLSDQGIQVYAVHPGWMKTDMGGDGAPTDPRDTACGILDIVERKIEISSKIAFINFLGKPMAL